MLIISFDKSNLFIHISKFLKNNNSFVRLIRILSLDHRIAYNFYLAYFIFPLFAFQINYHYLIINTSRTKILLNFFT